MDQRLNEVLDSLDREFGNEIQKGARHYLEVDIGQQAGKLGYADLKVKYGRTYAVIPLKRPRRGMKVRIDGRTFVNYAEYESGVAVPGYLSMETERSVQPFGPNDSPIYTFS